MADAEDVAIIEQDDKLVCRRRRIIERRDATEGLRYFARMQALSVVHLWDTPDVVLDYLMTGNARIRDAAWVAAWDAERTDFNVLVREAFGETR